MRHVFTSLKLLALAAVVASTPYAHAISLVHKDRSVNEQAARCGELASYIRFHPNEFKGTLQQEEVVKKASQTVAVFEEMSKSLTSSEDRKAAKERALECSGAISEVLARLK